MAFLVIGIVLAIGLPAFGSYRLTYAKRQAREQIIQDVRSARQVSVTQHSPVIMAFGNGVATTDITTYTIHVDRNGDGIKQSSEPRASRTLPKDTRLSTVALAPVDTLKFDISGILRPGTNGGTIIVANSRNVRDTLTETPGGMVFKQ
jgi:type II secretory pathway pseudopilin PulG